MGVLTKKGQRKGLNEEKKAIIEGNLKFHINITGKLNLTNISSIFFFNIMIFFYFTGLIIEIYPGVTVTNIHNIMRDRLELLRKKHT